MYITPVLGDALFWSSQVLHACGTHTPHMYTQVLTLSLSHTHKIGIMVSACNPRTEKTETGGSLELTGPPAQPAL